MTPSRLEIYYIEVRRHLRLLARSLVLRLARLPVVRRGEAVQRILRGGCLCRDRARAAPATAALAQLP
ncbi:MAG: hypothetical protein JST90_04215 [Bacteroidetes bacterium]|nr:hypothetical protein [Bacteroidota bacterium]